MFLHNRQRYSRYGEWQSALHWQDDKIIEAVGLRLENILLDRAINLLSSIKHTSQEAEDFLNCSYKQKLQKLYNPEVCWYLLYLKTERDPYKFLAFLKKAEVESRLATLSQHELKLANGIINRSQDLYLKVSPYATILSNTEWLYAVETINIAMESISLVSPAALKLIKWFTWSVELLQVPGEPGGSTSTGDLFGRTVIRNLLDADDPVLFAAESLLHEAIHHFLNVIEIDEPFVVKSLPKIPIYSKWTWNKIEAHSLIHACFVWYGLNRFFAEAKVAKVFSPIAIRGRLWESAKGFLCGGPVYVQLLDIEDYLDPSILMRIDDLQHEVRHREFAVFHSNKKLRQALIDQSCWGISQ